MPQRAFNYRTPRLLDTQASEMEKATTIRNLIGDITLVPLITLGAAKMGTVQLVAIELLLHMHVDEEHNALLRGTIQDIRDIAEYLKILTAGTDSDFPENALELVDKVAKSNVGTKQLIRQCVHQVPCYKKAESAVRTCELASMTFGPRLKSLKVAFEESASMAVLEQMLAELPRLLDSLPGGFATIAITRSDFVTRNGQVGKETHVECRFVSDECSDLNDAQVLDNSVEVVI
eukprot:6443539-Amphidinium_carterae.3